MDADGRYAPWILDSRNDDALLMQVRREIFSKGTPQIVSVQKSLMPFLFIGEAIHSSAPS
jgi:hypothetical protein